MLEWGFDPSRFLFAQRLFIQILALSYLFAYWSLFKQVLGLYGSQGIIPVQDTLRSFKARFRKKAYSNFPTIFWFNDSDQALRWIAGLGMIFSLFVLLGIAPAFFLLLLWMGYTSFMSIGLVFLGFQWDALLLETGFIAIFFALQSPPPVLLLLALWILLFRFMFSSGVVKILSGSPEWRHLTAMDYHYETQPIPNPIAYYVHQQPKWMAKLGTLMTFFIELIVPFFIFGPEPFRLGAFFLIVFFQLIIIFTGNFAFFNLLTIALCVTLLPNETLQWLYGSLPGTLEEPNLYVRLILEGIGAALILLNTLQLATLFVQSRAIQRTLFPFHVYNILNSYGLFAVMTTVRNEIIIEGSDDGEHWKTYEFKWKPGDLFRAPPQVAPYHPRLDWQMWFAALSPYQTNQWFINFLARLLQGSKAVTLLLETNPFPNKPPTFIRTLFYQYHFTDLATKRKTGQWWTRTFKGAYTPVFERKIADVDD